jgi:hypothetical protein
MLLCSGEYSGKWQYRCRENIICLGSSQIHLKQYTMEIKASMVWFMEGGTNLETKVHYFWRRGTNLGQRGTLLT